MFTQEQVLIILNLAEFLYVQFWLTWISSLFFMLAIFTREKHKILCNIFEGIGILFVFSGCLHAFLEH